MRLATTLVRALITITLLTTAVATAAARQAPKVVLISLDGAQPALIERFLDTGVLDRNTGLGRLSKHGVVADQNIPATPSVTAVNHISLATGSTAVHNDISGNTFHPVAATIGTSISGFGAPIGGYRISPPGPSPAPTAEPIWIRLRQAGRQVVTATWPGGDGVDVSVAGALVQGAVPTRTVDYTVPFGAFGGVGAQGFALTAASFTAASTALTNQLIAAGHPSASPVMVTAGPLETIFCAPAALAFSPCGGSSADRTLPFVMKAAAIDTTSDGQVNYDTLVFFAESLGIPAGPFSVPSTGPAYAKAGGPSAQFFYEGSGNRVGTSFFVTRMDPNLGTVRFLRYSANFIPRTSPVGASVDDIVSHVGFWAAQADFRIPERIGTGFGPFPDIELETAYEDQVRTFVNYQTRLAQRAIQQNPGADLVMIYIEQPDGSGHQFTLTDPRQATNPADATSVGSPGQGGAAGQDAAKIARYDAYLKFAYRTASDAVEAIINTVGIANAGEPASDVIVVSDHGMAPFHTAVNLSRILSNAGIDTSLIGIRTTGPAANIYVNLQGRETNGAVAPGSFGGLVTSIAAALRNATDPNPFFNPGGGPLFTHVFTRPITCGNNVPPGFCTDQNIGQDTGDVLALLAEGYNFDGAQSPAVLRFSESNPAAATVFSVPNFYGAHGHDSSLPSMSAILYAAGPSFKHKKVDVIHGIDIAPTIMSILDVPIAPTADGEVIPKVLNKDKD